MFSSYMNGIEVEVSATLTKDSDFFKCQLPEVPVFSAVGNVEAQVNAITELPRVGLSANCGTNRPIRYIRITRNAEEAASQRWVMCHMGIYASDTYSGNQSSDGTFTDSVGFSGLGGGGKGVVELNGDVSLFKEDNTWIDAIIESLKDNTGVNIDSLIDKRDGGSSDSKGSKSSDSSNVDIDYGMDDDILHKLGFFNKDSWWETTDEIIHYKNSIDQPYYFIPIVKTPVDLDEVVVPMDLVIEEVVQEIEPYFSDFLPDGTLEIKFEPPIVDVPLQWAALWDESWTHKLT